MMILFEFVVIRSGDLEMVIISDPTGSDALVALPHPLEFGCRAGDDRQHRSFAIQGSLAILLGPFSSFVRATSFSNSWTSSANNSVEY
jgi:hypothetical protein